MSLINREALLAEYDRVHVGEPGKARKLIEDAPTVEPVRKGYWMEDDNEMRVACSECGEPNDSISDYCPNCGAKMEEGD